MGFIIRENIQSVSSIVEGQRYWYNKTINGVTKKYALEALVSASASGLDLRYVENLTPKIWRLTDAQAISLNPEILPYDTLVTDTQRLRNETFALKSFTDFEALINEELSYNIPIVTRSCQIFREVNIYDRYADTPLERKYAYTTPSGVQVVCTLLNIYSDARIKVTIKQQVTNLYSTSTPTHSFKINLGSYELINSFPDSTLTGSATWNVAGTTNDFFYFKIERVRGKIKVTKGAVNTVI